ncbi:MAG TPA: DUF5684 domain-containing protein [Anaerohalosphaeraceae bacterium]|nr:DUF5684 domain-containing protein [Anaerohalosphaeraceae bacterium]
MIHFKCPHCRTALQMENHYAGQAALCPTCSGQILVPFPGTSAKPIICICGRCKALYQIPAEQAGRQVSCPTCREPTQIPEQENAVSDSQMLRFTCRSCGQGYCLPSRYAGRKFTCPACKHACLVPTPKPAEQELILLEEKPPKETSAVFSEPPPIESEPSPTPRKPEKQKSVLFKAVAGVLGGIIGFSIAFWLVSSLKKSTPTPLPPPPTNKSSQEAAQNQPIDLASPAQNYPQAVDFSRSIITKLNRKSEDVKELIYLFPDQIQVSEQDLDSLLNALDIGRFSSLETAIEKARVEPGASYFITKTKAISDSNRIRTIRIGFVEIENNTEETISVDRFVFGISIFDENDTLLASAGQSDQNELLSLLNDTVKKYAISSPSSSAKERSFSERFEEFEEKYYCPIAIVLLLIGLTTLISMWVVFNKAGEPGWAVFVPIYNTIVFARIGGKSEWLGFLCALSPMIPFVGSILNLFLFLYLSVSVAKAFGKGTLFGFGMVFLPFVFFPILAFSESAYPQADV